MTGDNDASGPSDGENDDGDRFEADPVEWLKRAAHVLRGSSIDLEQYRPGEHGPLVSFEGVHQLADVAAVGGEDDPALSADPGGAPAGGGPARDPANPRGSHPTVGDRPYRELERYWVNAPFAFVSLCYDPRANEHHYHVVEPALDAFEYELYETLVDDIRDPLLFREPDDEHPDEVLKTELARRLEEYGLEVGMATFYRLYYYLHRTFRGYGRLDPLMRDPHIEDISCDGYDIPLFVYHDEYADVKTNVVYDKRALDSYVIQLAQRAGQHVSVGDPVVETTLPDGSRAELALGEEVTPHGSAFTVRKYAEDPFTPVDLLDYGTFTLEQMAYLWLAIENNRSLVFAGGTASGKTTAMNAVSMFIPPRSKVITIEDTRELALHHDNWLSSVTRERLDAETDITMYDLLRSALRHRPEYIVVGEVRGEEAMTLFQAMNTGHTTYSTMHADSVRTVVNRLENEPINVPRQMVQSLDIVCVQVLTRVDGERVRRNKVLAEIEGIDQRTGELDYSTAFEWNPADDSYTEGGHALLDEIRKDRGWSQAQLLSELRRRRRFLAALQAAGIDDYRRFTAQVNDYYADPEAAMADLSDAATAPSRATDRAPGSPPEGGPTDGAGDGADEFPAPAAEPGDPAPAEGAEGAGASGDVAEDAGASGDVAEDASASEDGGGAAPDDGPPGDGDRGTPPATDEDDGSEPQWVRPGRRNVTDGGTVEGSDGNDTADESSEPDP